MIFHILNMRQKDYEYITKLLFEADSVFPLGLQAAPIFTAANIGNPKLFETLIVHSKIPLSIILRQKQEYTFSSPDGTIKQHVDTPLSLILSRSESYPLIDVLVNLDEANSYKHLTSIDLSHTRTRNLPVELFKLRHLYRINISNNKLSTLSLLKLPQNCWPNVLRDLNISHNSLEQIPSEFFTLPCLEVLNVSHNSLKSLPERWWATKSISMLDISFNGNLKSLALDDDNEHTHTQPSPAIRRSSRSRALSVSVSKKVNKKLNSHCIACRMSNSPLKNLNASHCNIKRFPNFLAIFFPNLEILNLAHNKLLHCCAVNELPISLQYLDISNNLLSSQSNGKTFHIDNDLYTMSDRMLHNELCNLHTLKVANNVDLRTVNFLDVAEGSDSHVFFPNLQKLDLSNCGLQQAPENLEQLQDLKDLNISGNKDFSIPYEIISLESLVSFTYDGVKDPTVSETKREKQVCLLGRK